MFNMLVPTLLMSTDTFTRGTKQKKKTDKKLRNEKKMFFPSLRLFRKLNKK